jgi:hypothetical protein
MQELADNETLQAVQNQLHQRTSGRPFMNPKDTEHLIKALSSNWQAEMRRYYTYD